jgi:hypothetical protein
VESVAIHAARRTDRPGEDEVGASIAAAVADINTPGALIVRGLQAIDARGGPAVVADAGVIALSALPAERLGNSGSASMFARWLGFDRLRMPDPGAQEL